MISIVVPVYNVEKYLERCVNSLINQTYEDIEILLIDDGSRDGSGQICDEYVKKDSRIKAFHKENGGLSDARNYGMERATGEYIAFIDSDDYIEPDMMEYLIGSICGADMAMCGIYEDYASGVRYGYKGRELSIEVDNVEAFCMILEGSIVAASACNRIIKTEIARKQRFRVGRLYEDHFFNNDLMPTLNKVRINTRPLYHYVHREGSITTTFKSENLDSIAAAREALIISDTTMPGIKEYARLRLLWVYFGALYSILCQDNYEEIPEYKQVLSFLRSHTMEVFTNRHFTLARRIAAVVLKFNVKLYRWIILKQAESKKALHK